MMYARRRRALWLRLWDALRYLPERIVAVVADDDESSTLRICMAALMVVITLYVAAQVLVAVVRG